MLLARDASDTFHERAVAPVYIQRVLGQHGRHKQCESVSLNETAKYHRVNDTGSYEPHGQDDTWTQVVGNRVVKHYVISWLNADTAVVGIKDTNEVYGGTDGWGLGFPAVAGGKSEISGPEMDSIYHAQRNDAMAGYVLNKEIEEELLGQYELRGVPTRVNTSNLPNNQYQVWQGQVVKRAQPRPRPARPALPPPGTRLRLADAAALAHFENTRTVGVKLGDLMTRGITAASTIEEVLTEVADLAGTPVTNPQNRQAKIYLRGDNFPLRAFANQVKLRIGELSAAAGAEPQFDAETGYHVKDGFHWQFQGMEPYQWWDSHANSWRDRVEDNWDWWRNRPVV
jgi:hypothetical protein